MNAITLRRLAALNLAPEQMAEVLSILAEAQEADDVRKAKQRERKRRSRDSHETVTGQERDGHSDIPPKKIPPITPLKNNPPPTSEIKDDFFGGARARKPKVREELETVLSPDMATAVIDHRRAIKANLTPHGAKLLALNLAARGDPEMNANLMIERGWRGFKSEWADNDGKKTQQSRRQRGSLSDFAATFAQLAQERANARNGGGDDLRGSSPYDSAEDRPQITLRSIVGGIKSVNE